MKLGSPLALLLAIALASQAPRYACAQPSGDAVLSQRVARPPISRLPSPHVRRLPPSVQALPTPNDRPETVAAPQAVRGDFPALPPAPVKSGDGARDNASDDPLPPLEEELWLHGGSSIYPHDVDPAREFGDGNESHFPTLRLPENWHAPQPWTAFTQFLGTGPIPYAPNLRWPGQDGYQWEPRFVAYGSYELLAVALEAAGQRHDLIGHQMFVELDYRWTGTERAHMQWRPLGRQNTGGSFYQFSNPSGYQDNSTGIPERYWVEGEVASVFGGSIRDPFLPRDLHVVVGKFPYVLHNRLLMNDDILGIAINKNTIYAGDLSNVNVQGVLALDDVDAFTDGSANMAGINIDADWRHALLEMTYMYVAQTGAAGRSEQYAAVSATQLFGTMTATGRAMFKWGDAGGRGPGQLFALECTQTRVYDHGFLGIETGVYYATLFRATKGWNSIAGGNFDRLRTAFAVDPLVILSARRAPSDNTGLALGVQYFRHNEDESLIPEFAFDVPGGTAVWGLGLRYQRKTGPRTFLEAQGVGNFSRDPQYRRAGLFLSNTILF